MAVNHTTDTLIRDMAAKVDKMEDRISTMYVALMVWGTISFLVLALKGVALLVGWVN